MTYTDQLALLDAIENFSVPIIPPTTHFWMIRTKKAIFIMNFFQSVLLPWLGITFRKKQIFRNQIKIH